MNCVTYDKIKVKSQWNIQSLTELEVKIEPNKHGTVLVTGILNNDETEDQLSKEIEKDVIQVIETDESGNERIIIAAIACSVEIFQENGLCYIKIEGTSGTSLFDREVKSRSFQNINMTYKELVKQVIGDTPRSDVIFAIGENNTIGKPIIQYQESDWAFIKRVASHLQTIIIPEVTTTRPRFWVGFPQGEKEEISSEIEYRVWKDINRFKELGGEEEEYIPNQFLFYEIKLRKILNIGDKVLFKNKNMIVCAKKGIIENGLWVYTYVLGFKSGYNIKKQYNNLVSGMSIQGVVLDTTNQTAKLHLDIDNQQDKNTAYWYPYAPATGNMMYCMPKIGTKVALYFRDEKEENAQIIGCNRTNGGACAEIANPENRYFTTEYDKQMALMPGEISFSGIGDKESLLKISMKDELVADGPLPGINMESHKSISIVSKGVIDLNSDKKITIYTPAEMRIFQLDNQSIFFIEGEFHSLGEYGILKASHFMSFPPIDDAPKEKEFNWKKLIGNVLAGIAVVGVVIGAIVFLGPLGIGVITAAKVTACCWGAGIAGTAFLGAAAYSDYKDGEVREKREYRALGLQGAVTGAIAAVPSLEAPFLVLPKGALKTALFFGLVGGLTGQGTHDITMGELSGLGQYFSSVLLTILGNVGGWAFGKGLSQLRVGAVEDIFSEGSREAVKQKSRSSIKQALRTFFDNPKLQRELLKKLGVNSINEAKRVIQNNPDILLELFPDNIKPLWKIESLTRIVETITGELLGLEESYTEEEMKLQRIMGYEEERQEKINKNEGHFIQTVPLGN